MTNSEHIEIILSWVKKINKGEMFVDSEEIELHIIGDDIYTYIFQGFSQSEMNTSGKIYTLKIDQVKWYRSSTGDDPVIINFSEQEFELLTNEIGGYYAII